MNCEFCHRPVPTQRHHVAQGFRAKTDDMPELVADICLDCHQACHRMAGEDGRSIGLVIIERADRGQNLPLFWEVTGRKWPSLEAVDLWRRRLGVKR